MVERTLGIFRLFEFPQGRTSCSKSLDEWIAQWIDVTSA